jgi:hypothetical protein
MRTTLCAAMGLRGCGGTWVRRESPPIKHPEIVSGFGARTLGLKAAGYQRHNGGHDHSQRGVSHGVQLLHHVGVLRREGQYLNFYDSGKELYDVMCEMEGKLEVKSFFMMDENFLLHKRARWNCSTYEGGHKAWSLYVFSSANAISQYTIAGAGGAGRVLDLDGAGIARSLRTSSCTARTRSR